MTATGTSSLPKVSLLTVTFNRAKTLERTICSVLAQDYPAIEHIIIDGASTDGTAEILDRYRNRTSLIISEPDDGPIYAQNRGLKLASGEYVALVNSDDYLEPGIVRSVVEAFQSHPEAEIVHGNLAYDFPDIGEHLICRPFPGWEEDPFRWPSAFLLTYFIRREVLDRVGLFEPAWDPASDYDFYLRLRRHNIRFHWLDRVFVTMTAGGYSFDNPSGWAKIRQLSRLFGCPAYRAWLDYFRRVLERKVGVPVMGLLPRSIRRFLLQYFHNNISVSPVCSTGDKIP